MEELSQKFPHLANDIFDSLDDQSLACKLPMCEQILGQLFGKPAELSSQKNAIQSANAKTRAIIWRYLCRLYLRGLFAMLGHEAV